MKKVIVGIFSIGIILVFLYTGYYLYKKNQKPKETFKTTLPFKADIQKKTVATGSINPRKEILLKPQISGIIEKIYVNPGDKVVKGQTIARIQVIPENQSLNNAESAVNKAQIALEQSRIEFERREKLFKLKAISETEFNQYKYDYEQKKEDLDNAQNALDLTKEGVSKRQTKTTTIVTSTISGMILDVPVKEGSQVIQSNSFNDGTTIASVADMNDLIFDGKVDESEVGKIKEGMPLKIIVGAIEGQTYNAKLEYIAPKGTVDQGTVQFEIKAAIKSQGDKFIRAGYSANADIILDKRDSVLSILERDLQFEKDGSRFVEVETAPQVFIKKPVKLGLSDGINVEVLSGISDKDKIKVQE